MITYRYSTRAVTHDEDGTLFPMVMAGLLGLWALIAVAISCGPKLAAVELEAEMAKTFVSCEPTGGQLLRCTAAPAITVIREI